MLQDLREVDSKQLWRQGLLNDISQQTLERAKEISKQKEKAALGVQASDNLKVKLSQHLHKSEELEKTSKSREIRASQIINPKDPNPFDLNSSEIPLHAVLAKELPRKYQRMLSEKNLKGDSSVVNATPNIKQLILKEISSTMRQQKRSESVDPNSSDLQTTKHHESTRIERTENSMDTSNLKAFHQFRFSEPAKRESTQSDISEIKDLSTKGRHSVRFGAENVHDLSQKRIKTEAMETEREVLQGMKEFTSGGNIHLNERNLARHYRGTSSSNSYLSPTPLGFGSSTSRAGIGNLSSPRRLSPHPYGQPWDGKTIFSKGSVDRSEPRPVLVLKRLETNDPEKILLYKRLGISSVEVSREISNLSVRLNTSTKTLNSHVAAVAEEKTKNKLAKDSDLSPKKPEKFHLPKILKKPNRISPSKIHVNTLDISKVDAMYYM